MSVSEATTGGKSVAELVENLENQAARRSDANWHEGLKSSTKIALEKLMVRLRQNGSPQTRA